MQSHGSSDIALKIELSETITEMLQVLLDVKKIVEGFMKSVDPFSLEIQHSANCPMRGRSRSVVPGYPKAKCTNLSLIHI